MTFDSGVTEPMRWAALSLPREGERVSGDRHVVRAVGDAVWIAVIDGLGHGVEAAHAAAQAARVLETAPFGTVVEALQGCHVALARTRGAVMSIVRVERGELSWVGIGNVETVVVRSATASVRRARLVLYGGVVGHMLPVPRPSTCPIARGDLLVLVTDGIASEALDQVDPLSTPERAVEQLMARHRSERDDALALAARYDGRAS